MLWFLLSCVSSKCMEKFPFTPIILHDDSGRPYMYDYFDYHQLNPSRSSTPVIKRCTASMKNGKNISKCINHLDQLAEDQDVDSAFLLGTIFEFGLFKQKYDLEKARKYYKIGASVNHAHCLFALGYLMRYGMGGEIDVVGGTELNEKAIEYGSIWALFRKSTDLNLGITGKIDYLKAFDTIRETSQIILDNLTFMGFTQDNKAYKLPFRKLPKDESSKDAEIKDLLLRSAKSGNPYGYYNLGKNCLYKTPPKYDCALYYLELASQKNSAEADGLLGVMYKYGLGVKKNVKMAQSYFDKGMSKNEPVSLTEVAKSILMNPDSSTETRRLAKESLDIAAQKGYVDAQYMLGLYSLTNNAPFKKDLKMAVRYFEKAFDSNVPVIFTFSTLCRDGVFKRQNSMTFLKIFCEYTFLYDDMRYAHKVLSKKKNVHYALAIYSRLADCGSEISALNADELCRYLKKDSTPWVHLLYLMNNSYAFFLKGEDYYKMGNKTEAFKLWSNVSSKHTHAAFKLGFFDWENMTKSYEYLDLVSRVRPKSFIAVYIAKAYVFYKNIPRILRSITMIVLGKSTDEQSDFIAITKKHMKFPIMIILLILLYIMIGKKVRWYTKVRFQEQEINE